MPGYAEIYAELLYLGGEGYPLWYPSALRLGDVGYIRDGSFKQLYNIVDGPGTQFDAASLLTAIHSDRSPSSEHGHGESSAKKARLNPHDPVGAPTDPVSPSPSSSLAASPLISSVSVGMSRSHSSEPLLPHSAQKGSPTFLHRRFHSGTPPEPSQPPGRFEVRELATSPPFHMGPRMSSSFRCLGVNGDASVPSSPANVKIGFESSGGDGAILIPRDPTEITELDDLGELKAYVKKHYEWMYQTYGEAKSIKTKDLTLIYKQYRTSDWAMAVICHGDKRVKAEFEVFGSVSAGFWGNWSSGVTASQRGPHRPQRARDTHNFGQGKPPALLQRHGKGNSSLGVSIDGGLNHQSFSYASSSSKESAYNGLGRRSRKENTADSSPKPMDQTILINRLTVSSVLGFLPVRIKAAAEPRDPDMDRDQDHGSDAVSGQDGNQGGDDDPGKRNHWSDDPLEALHDWIHKHGGAQIKVSIASDDDCLQLLRQLGQRYASKFGLRAAVRTAADRFARISVDEAGFATVSISRVPFKASKLVSTPSAALDPSPKTTAADHDTQFDLRQGEHGSKYDCRCET